MFGSGSFSRAYATPTWSPPIEATQWPYPNDPNVVIIDWWATVKPEQSTKQQISTATTSTTSTTTTTSTSIKIQTWNTNQWKPVGGKQAWECLSNNPKYPNIGMNLFV